MVADAEARKAEMTTGHEVNDVLSKDKAEPRITRVGAVLHRYSIDDLPQLINVMRVEMSLVGPGRGCRRRSRSTSRRRSVALGSVTA